jgi:hypothetical protein
MVNAFGIQYYENYLNQGLAGSGFVESCRHAFIPCNRIVFRFEYRFYSCFEEIEKVEALLATT